MRSDYLNNNSSASEAGLNAKFEVISAARTLDAMDSGKVFGINQASVYEITLPLVSSVSPGWNVKFMLKGSIRKFRRFFSILNFQL